MQHNVPVMVSNKNRWLCFRALFALPSVSAMTHMLNVSQTKTTETQREEKLLARASFCLQDNKEFRKWSYSKSLSFHIGRIQSVGVRDQKISILSIKVLRTTNTSGNQPILSKTKGIVDLQSCGSHGGHMFFWHFPCLIPT